MGNILSLCQAANIYCYPREQLSRIILYVLDVSDHVQKSIISVCRITARRKRTLFYQQVNLKQYFWFYQNEQFYVNLSFELINQDQNRM